MMKWVFLFSISLSARPVFAQLHFSILRADSVSGDTAFLHATGATSRGVLRFFNKNLMGYRGDTAILGEATVYLSVDTLGKVVEVHPDPSGDKEVIREVTRVADRMNISLPMTPTTIRGKPVVSVVRVRAVFHYDETPVPPSSQPDILVTLFPVVR